MVAIPELSGGETSYYASLPIGERGFITLQQGEMPFDIADAIVTARLPEGQELGALDAQVLEHVSFRRLREADRHFGVSAAPGDTFVTSLGTTPGSLIHSNRLDALGYASDGSIPTSGPVLMRAVRDILREAEMAGAKTVALPLHNLPEAPEREVRDLDTELQRHMVITRIAAEAISEGNI